MGLETDVDWLLYEKAVFNDLYYAYHGPTYEVRFDDRALGRYSGAKRQLDVAVYGGGDPTRLLLSISNLTMNFYSPEQSKCV